MPKTIKYSLNIQVVGGSSIPVAGEISPDACEMIQFALEANKKDLEVNLQPDGDKLGEFLLIKASSYTDDTDSHCLTYKVNDASGTAISLDAPHVFFGKGAVALLDDSPTKLFFSSTLTADITIDILIGRDATP